MPRQARLEIAGIPLHVIQRGVNRCAIFIDDDDRRHYLRLLAKHAKQQQLRIHAYVLMGNHTHLLVSSDRPGIASAVMHRLGLNYVAAFNRRYRRTGTLWEGRFKSCLVNSDRHLLTVYRYIELNPVRAALAERPELYAWSSARGNLHLRADPLLTPHATFLAFDSIPEGYRRWLEAGIEDHELSNIRLHIKQGRALGDCRFVAMAGRTLGRHVALRKPGRPGKAPEHP